MGAGYASSGSVQGDGITITDTSASLAITQTVQIQISDAIVGVVFAESSTGYTFTNGIADYFGDASGNENTIDTGTSTTAIFSTNKYYADFGINQVQACGITVQYTAGTTDAVGEAFTPSQNVKITKITKSATCAATKGYVKLFSDGTVLASASFVGNDATVNYDMTAGIKYLIVVDSEGANYNMDYRDVTPPYPITCSLGAYNSGREGAGNRTDRWYSIVSITVNKTASTSNYLLSAALPGLDGSRTKIRFHPYNFVQGSSGLNTVTYDVDYTGNGTYELTGQSADTWIDLGGAQTFNSAKIRIALNRATGNQTDEPSLQGYTFLVV